MSGEQLVLWWAARYTRGLDEQERDDRRSELASDLWEHRATLGSGPSVDLAILSRCVRGMPADLSWRRAQRRGSRIPSLGTVARGLGWSLAGMAYVLLVAIHSSIALPLLGLQDYPDWDDGEAVLYSWIGLVFGTLLLAGAIVLPKLPRAGAALVVAAALGTPIAFFWAAFAWGPVGLVVTAAAILLARRRRGTLLARAH